MKTETIILGEGIKAKLVTVGTVVVGSGAAGLNCCERLAALGYRDVVMVTNALGGGTSNLSGSDKQTYYKLGMAGGDADSPLDFAKTLTAGGMMHGDIAYIEGVLSPAAFFHLAEIGVPFPHDRLGTYVGYKTDHDPRQRATSAGPKTSHFMVQCSLKKVKELGVKIFDKHQACALLTGRRGEAVGLLTLDRQQQAKDGLGLTLFNCVNVVLATGGPGELYKTSVYPLGQAGAHGLALKTGAEANNLAESQFGLASTKFRWNLSGTYQQVIPHYFSTDANGKGERNFLPEYFKDMPTLATAIFLKGYQWPFHAAYTQGMGSSIIDLAVQDEINAGRRVFLDFTRNPVAANGLAKFDLNKLKPEALSYLKKSGALQKTPYLRLKHMNPDSISLYTEHSIDLKKPLECAVCFQHNNGGLTGDAWWESNVPHLFVIGETCGCHGVRPGGSALNSGQVGGIRAAERIARRYNSAPQAQTAFIKQIKGQVENELANLEGQLAAGQSAPGMRRTREEIQARMSRAAAFIRDPELVSQALAEAKEQWNTLRRKGQRLRHRAELPMAIENQQLCLTQIAFLESINALIKRGGGSRGSYMVLDNKGGRWVETRKGKALRHRPENIKLREEILAVRYDVKKDTFSAKAIPTRPLPTCDAWYETTWAAYKSGEIFK